MRLLTHSGPVHACPASAGALPWASPSPTWAWGGWAGRSQPSARHCKRKRRETAPVSPTSEAWKTLQLERTQRTFQTLQPRCPMSDFFFFFFTAIRVTSLSKGQQLARASRKLVWHQAGIGATLTS